MEASRCWLPTREIHKKSWVKQIEVNTAALAPQLLGSNGRTRIQAPMFTPGTWKQPHKPATSALLRAAAIHVPTGSIRPQTQP